MRPRIDWAPGDRALATCLRGAVHLHDSAAPVRARELASHGILDARWLPNGRVVGIDNRGWQQWSATGELVAQRHASEARVVSAATLAADGSRFVGVTRNRHDGEVWIKSIDGERVWTLNLGTVDTFVSECVAMELSGDGAIVGVGFVPRDAGHHRLTHRLELIIIDVAADAVIDRCTAYMAAATTTTLALAFDATGDRMVVSSTGLGPGVIRVAAHGAYLRHDANSPIALALDDTGHLAAFSFATTPDGAHGRLRVDYLSHVETGANVVEALDTLTLDPALPDIVALAFSRDSRSLACLASTGAIEVVPVP